MPELEALRTLRFFKGSEHSDVPGQAVKKKRRGRCVSTWVSEGLIHPPSPHDFSGLRTSPKVQAQTQVRVLWVTKQQLFAIKTDDFNDHHGVQPLPTDIDPTPLLSSLRYFR